MDRSSYRLAAEVVARAGPRSPADAVLRGTLKRQRQMSREQARAIASLVFAWFRWRGWLDPLASVNEQFIQVTDLDDRFRHDPESFSDHELARAVPDWTWDEMNVSAAWLRSLQTEPRIWLRAKQGQGRALAQKLGECWIPDSFPDAVEYRGTEDLFRSSEFQAGEFELQDIASQVVGLLCDPKPGETWWDACAGEGGKTLHLSDLMRNKGLIWASDRAPWRLKKLKLRTARAKCFNYRAVLWDGGVKPPTKTKFDGVLVDAPCSVVGTWQRNPHARWTTGVNDVRELAEVQGELLSRVASSVKPGGKLIYAVCTLTRLETEGVVKQFEAGRNEFEPLVLSSPQSGMRPLTSVPMTTLWPQEFGGNGMFVAAWRRTNR